MILRIKKRSQSQWLVIYAFAMSFLFYILIDMLYFPSFIKYTIDGSLILLLLIACLKRRIVLDPQVADVMRVVLIFALLTVIGQMLEYQSIAYYLWGIRNNFRFFIFFMMCTMVLKRDDADFCMKFMDGVFYINLVLSLYQVLVLKEHQDRIGGIFGASRGCNVYTNIYLMIIVAWYMLRYMSNKATLMQMVTRCGISLLLAAIAELKMFFVEFALITVLATLMTKFSYRKLFVIIVAALGLMVGIQGVRTMFPYFADFFNINAIIETASAETGYTNTNDLNRLSAVVVSWNRFLDTWPRKLLGLGLGNCDYSTNFTFLMTPFYERYGALNYTWFSSAFLILETGLVGLVVYVLFFVRVYRTARIVEKKDPENQLHCQLARIMAIMAPILIVYNASLRVESAYMYFFVLALPFIKEKNYNNKFLITEENGGKM